MTGTQLYNDTSISAWNLIFTSLPVLAFALLEQDVGRELSLKHPSVYAEGPANKFLNTGKFLMWMAEAGNSSRVVLCLTVLSHTVLFLSRCALSLSHRALSLKAKELKTKISLTNSLILSHCALSLTVLSLTLCSQDKDFSYSFFDSLTLCSLSRTQFLLCMCHGVGEYVLHTKQRLKMNP